MTRWHRWEAGLALAMLPVGVVLGVMTALASIALLIGAIPALMIAGFGMGDWWLPAWCFAGGAMLAWVAVTAIEIVSAFDWRPLPRALAAVAAVAASCPWWR